MTCENLERGRAVVGGVGGVAPAVAVGEVRFPRAVTLSPYRFVLDRNQANVYVDLSGTPLAMRGYRTSAGTAPLRENLAASA